jgi:hypothetical protein|tara:strand:+ start:6705 stop:7253 length:549 start_codon:yes stop_codon:yes gene_type:complete
MTNKKTIKALAKSGNLNKILQLKLRGYSNASIAESMNTTSYKIVKQFKEALETVNDDSSEKIKTIRDTTHLRYESLLVELYGKIKKQVPKKRTITVTENGQRINKIEHYSEEELNYDSIDKILKIIEGQRKLFGIDSEKAEINIDNRQQTFTIDENFDYRAEMDKKWNNLKSDINVVDSKTN